MSWSVNAVGNAAAVAVKLAADFERIKCSEPEETIKNTIASAVATALAAFDAKTPVEVKASGSQSISASSDAPSVAVNQLQVSIQPLWGFLS